MPVAARPPALRGAVFRGRDVVAAGLLTPDQLRSTAWRRLYRGIYADAALQPSVDLRIRGAALLVPGCAAFSGRSAAHLLGAPALAAPDGPIEVSVPADQRFGPVRGLVVRRLALPPSDVTTVRGVRCTTALRTATDIARDEALPDSVVALDVLLASRVVGERQLREAVTALVGQRGGRRARRAVDLADPRAESQPESRLRVVLALAGLPAVPQHVVRDGAGRFVARVDLAFPDVRVAVEYDGAWHGAPGQLSRDRRRHNALTRAGWTVVYVTAAQLRDPVAVVALVRDIVQSATAGKPGVQIDADPRFPRSR